MAGYAVALGSEAAAALRRRGPRPRGMLALRLAAAAERCPAPGLLVISGPDAIGACEVLAERELILIYAVIPWQDVERALLGAELQRKIRSREIRRATR